MKEHDFFRTTCACENCVACCKRQPGPLILSDVDAISGYLAEKQGVTREVAFEGLKKQLWASPGALVKDLETGQISRIGSITPRMKNGRCVFLDDHDRCSIHPVAPFGCSHFDVHMDFETAHPRSLFVARKQMEPEFKKLRDQLPMATSYKPRTYP